MRKTAISTLSCLVLLAAYLPCAAQTSEDINKLLRKSKLVGTGREVNTRIGETEMTISTFAHPKASNQDVKITALFMMKEIRQHYKNILSIDVLFYDQANASRYREVEIREGDIALVDAGKPIKEILAQISVRDHNAAVKSASAARSTSAGAEAHAYVQGLAPANVPVRSAAPIVNSLMSTVNSLLPGAVSASDELALFRSPDGSLQMLAPKNWAQDASGLTGDVMTFGTFRNGATISLHVGHPVQMSGSLDALIDQHYAEARAKYSNVRILTRRNQNCAGVPAVYAMGTGYLGGTPCVERDILLRKGNQVYYMYMYSTVANDQGLESLFQKMADSARIR